MTFDFNRFISRENTSCVKYDLRQAIFGKPDVLPMWVADMDIPTPEFIIDAIRKRLNHPVLGYTFRDSEYHNAISWWYKHRHCWDIKADWIDFCPGVVSGLSHAIRAFTMPGDAIIIQPPVYRPFFSTVTANNRKLILNPLVENNGQYAFDYDLLEKQASQGARMLILSNPHNPVGKLWSKEELLKLGEICIRHNLIIVSDEIHSDLVFEGNTHFSIASLSEKLAAITITFSSMSKTFNLAGLASGFVIIPNPVLKAKYAAELEASGAGMGNIFGFEALKAAFTPQGQEWLNALMQHLNSNWELLSKGLATYSKIKVNKPDATYLVWADFRKTNLTDDQLNKLLVHEAGLGFSPGTEYGHQGTGFQRINIACPNQTIELALSKFAKIARHLE